MKLQDKVTQLKGIGPKKAEALKRLGIETLEDLILFFPRDYEDRRSFTEICRLEEGVTCMIKARVLMIVKDRYSRAGRKQLLRLLVSDDTGTLEIVFFNAKYMQSRFEKGREYIFYGKTTSSFGKPQMVHPEFDEGSEKKMGLFPVYPLTKGITQKEMRRWQEMVKPLHKDAEEILSPRLIRENRLCHMEYALDNIHFPQEKQRLLEAKYRLVFDELLIFQIGLFAARANVKNGKKGIAFCREADISPYISSLPYELTAAQRRCISEIEEDLICGKAMNRLVQGDVGSGKTAVAEAAMYKAVKSGYQAALMAPTEILARQHFEGMSTVFSSHGIKVGFLSGSMKAAEKKAVLDKIKKGQVHIVIGTHALLQPEVEFRRLGLVITDEQHRFGVRQRVKLKEKGKNPNVLVMTATPIPRTLSVILYGDLDVSVIDELPPGRQAVSTRSIGADKRDKCYDFVETQLRQGRQAYVVTPLIEESEVMDVKSAQQTAKELQARFSDYKVALLHGAMRQQEKDCVMSEFYEGRIDVLVATVVIEVGINVPNATVMVIENSERFGLAQLHQLRGRVGRGHFKSYCFLIMQAASEIAKKRGAVMESSSDGFFIAEEDLKLRGPGEIFGTRQHGLPDLNISDLSRHLKILEHARSLALAVLEEDPDLEGVGNRPLKRRITKLFGEDVTLAL